MNEKGDVHPDLVASCDEWPSESVHCPGAWLSTSRKHVNSDSEHFFVGYGVRPLSTVVAQPIAFTESPTKCFNGKVVRVPPVRGKGKNSDCTCVLQRRKKGHTGSVLGTHGRMD
ncbi:unnamed protein product [Scytosiphon promiscuus]